MKKLLAVSAACLALAACGKSETPAAEATTAATPEATATAASAPTTDPALAAAMAGTYEVKLADGRVVMETINADGTFVDMIDGKELQRGTWRQDNEKTCFDPAGDAPEACYTGGVAGPDGSFETRDDKGNVYSTVRKVATGATPAPAAPAAR